MLFRGRQPGANKGQDLPPVRHSGSQLILDAYAASETGHRLVNEDAFLCLVSPPSPAWLDGLFVVADGIGGRQNGQIASALAVRAVRDAFTSTDRYFSPRAARELLQHAFSDAHRAVAEAASDEPTLQNMGTTLTVAAVAQHRVYLGSVGDSRAYLHRGRKLAPLTTDDWFQAVAEPTDEAPDGMVTVVTQAIGWNEPPAPKLVDVEVGDGDLLLLCSDGLTGEVTDRQIESACSRFRRRVDITVRKLLDAALAAPEPDNVTVVLARMDGR